jgi:acyl-CoA thioester hydrolase
MSEAFAHPVRVYWEDTDAGGVVFYANYLKFFERARTEWLRAAGFGQEQLRSDHGVMFVVCDTALQYRQPARLDDQLSITVEPEAPPRGAALTLAQSATRGSTRLVDSRITIACVDAASLKPRRIPKPLLEALFA